MRRRYHPVIGWGRLAKLPHLREERPDGAQAKEHRTQAQATRAVLVDGNHGERKLVRQVLHNTTHAHRWSVR